jgi:hypothetical protein
MTSVEGDMDHHQAVFCVSLSMDLAFRNSAAAYLVQIFVVSYSSIVVVYVVEFD